jgi:hypothetical protein
VGGPLTMDGVEFYNNDDSFIVSLLLVILIHVSIKRREKLAK